MADEFSNQPDTRKSDSKERKGLCQILIGKIRRLFSCSSRNNTAVVDQSPLDPSLEAVSSPKHIQSFKREADPVHTDHVSLLEEDKTTLQTEGETQWEYKNMKTLLTEDLDEKFMQLEKEKSQQILLSIEQSLLQNPPMVRLEQKVMKVKKELTEMELANQIMQTQLRKVIHIQLMDFRECVMKMMDFNIEISDQEITDQFWPPINPYGINYV